MTFKGKAIKGHQLSFLAKHGYIPEMIDHKNHIKDDNWWENLRDVTSIENQQNQKSARKDSTSGHKGVSWEKRYKKWYAHLTVNGKVIYLGSFKEQLDAIEARKQGELKYYTHSPHQTERNN